MKKKVLSMMLAFAMILVQIPASVYVLAAERDSGIVLDSAAESDSTGWTIDDVLDLIDALPQADEVADESKVEIKRALDQALDAYSAALQQADIDPEVLRDAVGDERREKLRALSDLLSDVEVPDEDAVLDSGTPDQKPKVLSVYAWHIPEDFLTDEPRMTQQDGIYYFDLSETAAKAGMTHDVLTAMLPEEVIVQAGEGLGEETVGIQWACGDYIQDVDGLWPLYGEYVFSAALPEGFALLRQLCITVLTYHLTDCA